MSSNEKKTDPQKVKNLLHTKLRMVQIRNEIEMLQNPSLRKAYEEVNFKTDSASNGSGKKTSDKPSVFIVTNKSPISGQIEYMEAAKLHVQSNEAVTLLPSLKVSGMFETLSNFY